jgi:hypothetical protein
VPLFGACRLVRVFGTHQQGWLDHAPWSRARRWRRKQPEQCWPEKQGRRE